MFGNLKILNRSFRAFLASALVLGLVFVISCDNGGDDPEPELYPLHGVYTFKKAVLQTEITIPGLPIPIGKGTDITDEMEGGLLAEAPCKDPENGAVELKENNELFFTCIGEDNELKAGTWSVNDDRTELSLILSIAIGTLPLDIQELFIDEANDVIGGTISNFPITKDLLAGFLADVPGGDAILAGLPDDYTVVVSVDIEFQKVME